MDSEVSYKKKRYRSLFPEGCLGYEKEISRRNLH